MKVVLGVVPLFLLTACSSGRDVAPDSGAHAGSTGSVAGAGGEVSGAAGAAGDSGAGSAGHDAGATGAAGSATIDAAADADHLDAAAPRDGRDAGDAAPAPGIRYVGRVDRGDAKGARFAWSGSGFVASFSGTSVGVRLSAGQQYTVLVDGVLEPKLVPTSSNATVIATGLSPGAHTLELYRRTEPEWGESQLLGLELGAGTLLAPPPAPARRLEVIGDSISTGFGDEGADPCPYTIETENHYVTWGAVAARAVGAEVVTTAWQGKGLVCNVGDGPCTMPFPTYYDRTLPMRADSKWDFKAWQPHAVVINLGTNDFSSAVDPTPAEFAAGYVAFLKHIRGNYPGALILLTCGPMLGAGELQKVKDGIASAIATVGDARIESFDLAIQTGATGCGSHPNVATHQKMAGALIAKLKAELGW